jgi:very-short-patch-repair endonuclease
MGGSVVTFEQQALAACLAVGGLVGASHRAAAHLWGVELPEAPRVEVTVTVERHPQCPGVIVHRSTDLAPSHIFRRLGIPVTTPLRLLVDLGAVSPTTWVEDALDDLVGRRLLSVAGARRTLDELAAPGRSGVGTLRTVLDRRTGNELHMSRSRLEALFVRLAAGAGLPSPEFQHRVVIGGRVRRIDFAFPALRLAIEVDGYQSHTTWAAFQDDRVRRNELELAGWKVLQFTWHQLTRRPDYVIRVLTRALLEAA